jgi:hypothetical protein
MPDRGEVGDSEPAVPGIMEMVPGTFFVLEPINRRRVAFRPSPVHADRKAMRLFRRFLGVAALAVALLNASAGLCVCHHGPALPGAPAPSHSCCHGPDGSGTTALKAASTCCHIESAESSATPAAAVQFAPPATLAAAVPVGASAVEMLPTVARALPGSSPPLFVLRI